MLDVQELRRHVRGGVIVPGDADYDSARRVYNGMIDRRPIAIARCSTVGDVIASVRAGVESDLPIAIRGGGHSAGGLGVCNDGLVVDLSGLRGVRVDAEARIARVDGGCTWGGVDRATHAYGLAVPSGLISMPIT
jgi:FAD/FMN-containing dehydrogenase